MLYINDWSINMLKNKFPRLNINPKCPSGSWQTSRYIQIYIDGYDHDLHYEYRIDGNWNGRVELHFEGDWETKYGILIDRLMNNTQNSDELIWSEWDYGSRCSLNFPYLLLQVLYRKLGRKINCKINDFFKPNNLLSIFEEYLPFNGSNVNKEDIKDFMEMLVRARLALDICFIRPTDYGYSLDMNLNEDNESLKDLLMLQSMLYVSSSNYTNYRWFNWLMDEVERYGLPDVNLLYSSLKKKLDDEFPLPEYEALTYSGDNRYWFWRLDFYIWQHRKELFHKDSQEMTIVENYVFKRNRSIEHIAPQTPQSNSMMVWEDTPEDARLRDSFGNLVMISQGLNSALSNESYEVKTAHVQSYYNGAKSGSIESLKLLLVHQNYSKWDREAIKEHGENMYELLVKSFEKQE